MTNLIPWRRPSMLSLQRDVEDVLDEYAVPRALKREAMQLFDAIPSPEPLWREIDRMFETLDAPPMLRRRVDRLFEETLHVLKMGAGYNYGSSYGYGFSPSYAYAYANPSYALGNHGYGTWSHNHWTPSWGKDTWTSSWTPNAYTQPAFGQSYGFGPHGFGPHASNLAHKRMFAPQVEIVERDNEFVLKCDLPGVREQDIDIRIEDESTITISGERREDETKRVRGYEYTERPYGAFARSVTLPRGVDVTKIDADFRAGVLEIHVPKSEASRARRIMLTQEGRVSTSNGPGIHAHAAQMRVP
jgi:HSP20 family protein